MSTPEARLSAAERAALADLESAAAAADPNLAARLRGSSARALPLAVSARAWLVAGWEWSVDRGSWGLPLTVVGLFLVVVGVSAGLYLSLIGAGVMVAALAVLAEMVDRRWVSPRGPRGSAPEA